MDDGLNSSALGALVLLALLVIFLPVLFDRNRVEPVDPPVKFSCRQRSRRAHSSAQRPYGGGVRHGTTASADAGAC